MVVPEGAPEAAGGARRRCGKRAGRLWGNPSKRLSRNSSSSLQRCIVSAVMLGTRGHLGACGSQADMSAWESRWMEGPESWGRCCPGSKISTLLARPWIIRFPTACSPIPRGGRWASLAVKQGQESPPAASLRGAKVSRRWTPAPALGAPCPPEVLDFLPWRRERLMVRNARVPEWPPPHPEGAQRTR